VAEVITLVCSCGKRLKAVGATPGRLGRCPKCGQMLRMPEAQPAPVVSSIEPQCDAPEDVASGGYAVSPASHELRPPTFFAASHETQSGSESARLSGQRGLIPAPTALETRFRDSLLYPFWDDQCLAVLVFLPAALWLTSLPVLGLVPPIVRNFDRFSIMAPFAFPMVFIFAIVVGYALLYLGQVLITSGQGEIDHPRLPEWDFWRNLASLARWLWASLVGFALGGLPAAAYWVRCGDLDLFDRIILSELMALGAAYSQMALVASLLHDDFRAANPVTVVQAIMRLGWSYVWPCLVTGAAIGLAFGVASLAWNAPNDFLAVLGLWVFWVFVMYEAVVVFRILGLFYHRHASKLGWFHNRPQWGVRS
jgi:hypothetical protein